MFFGSSKCSRPTHRRLLAYTQDPTKLLRSRNEVATKLDPLRIAASFMHGCGEAGNAQGMGPPS